MFYFFGHKACGILAPQPGIKPTSSALEGEVLTTGPPGKPLGGPSNVSPKGTHEDFCLKSPKVQPFPRTMTEVIHDHGHHVPEQERDPRHCIDSVLLIPLKP